MALIFQDTFTEATDTDLHLHTPDTGTSWTVVWQSGVGSKYTVIAANDYCRQADTANSGAIYSADATYDSADYSIECSVVGFGGSSSPTYLFLRMTDQENLYALRMQQSGGVAAIHKKVAGTWTLLGVTFTGPSVGDVVKFEVIGDTLKVYYNDVEQASRTDTDLTATGKAGIGMGGGEELVAGGHDGSVNNIIDGLAVNTVGGGSTDRVAHVSFAEIEIPSAGRVAQISWAELEIPNAPRSVQVSWLEFETPDAGRAAQVAWVELELPEGARSAQVSWAELEVPAAPRAAHISWVELRLPDVGGDPIPRVAYRLKLRKQFKLRYRKAF